MTPVSSGSWARKIRIASALTKPVITDCETNRMTRPSFKQPGPDLDDTHQDRGGVEVLHAVVAHER